MEIEPVTQGQLEDVEQAIDSIFELLGFGPMEKRTYATLLQTEEPLRATPLSERADVSRGRIYEVLENLQRAGFVSEDAEGISTFTAYQPEVAIPSYLDALEREITGMIPEVEDMETTSLDMAAGRLRIAHADEDIARVQTGMYSRAKRKVNLFEVRTLFPETDPGTMNSENLWYQTKTLAMERCTDFRILVDYDVLSSDTLRDRVEAAIELGMEIRMADDLPLHALVIDDRHVMMNIPESPSLPVNPQIYVRHPGLARALAMTFDLLWDLADEYESPDEDEGEEADQQGASGTNGDETEDAPGAEA